MEDIERVKQEILLEKPLDYYRLQMSGQLLDRLNNFWLFGLRLNNFWLCLPIKIPIVDDSLNQALDFLIGATSYFFVAALQKVLIVSG